MLDFREPALVGHNRFGLAALDGHNQLWVGSISIDWSEPALVDQDQLWLVKTTFGFSCVGWSEPAVVDQDKLWLVRTTFGFSCVDWSETALVGQCN